MIPTLSGRIQTRIFVLAVIGSLTTLIVSLVLPSAPASLGDTYKATFCVLIAVAVLGIGWELVYHGLMQFRWERDWPMLLGLVTAVNEGALVWSPSTFLFVNGPMRVPFIRWRHNGGRLV